MGIVDLQLFLTIYLLFSALVSGAHHAVADRLHFEYADTMESE